MSAEALFNAARTVAVLAVLLMLVQVAWMTLRSQRANRQKVVTRLAPAREGAVENREPGLASDRYQRLALRAGVNITQQKVVIAVMLVVALTVVVLSIQGLLIALLVPVAAFMVAWLGWSLLYQRQRRVIFENLPSLIDEVIRNIDAGRSLEQALVSAFRDAPAVFEPLSFRLRSAVDAGRDYTHLMDEFAELYAVPPLVFVAVALRTSSRFGSSVRPILSQVSKALRTQEEMRREFMAASSETRFTAAAFAILPIGIGVYVLAMNESFRDIMLNTPTGNRLLAIAVTLIVIGVAINMKMVRGVGRD